MILNTITTHRNFKGSDLAVSKYIMLHPEAILTMSAQMLAKESFVSPSSVVRFCQSLGFSGYVDFQRQYNFEYGQRHQHDQALKEDRKDAMHAADAIQEIYTTTVNNTRRLINESHLNWTVRKLKELKRVDFYASSQNFPILQNYCLKLISLNIHAQAFNDLHIDYLNQVNPRDCLCVVVSQTGNNPNMLGIASKLKAEHFKTVAITSSINRDLEKLCNTSLYVPSAEGTYDRIQRAISLEYLLDVIYLSLVKK